MDNSKNSLLHTALQYDLFFNNVKSLLSTSIENDYLIKLKLIEELMSKIGDEDVDRNIMKEQLKSLQEECDKFSYKLKTSARLLDEIQLEKSKIEYERDCLKTQLDELYSVLKKPNPEVLFQSSSKDKQSTKNKHLDNTDAMLSDLSYSRTDSSNVSLDRSDSSIHVKNDDIKIDFKESKQPKVNVHNNEKNTKSCKSTTVNINGGQIIATTTVTMNSGTIHASSVIKSQENPETVFSSKSTFTGSIESLSSNEIETPNKDKISSDNTDHVEKKHNFVKKKVVITELCGHCLKKVKFNSYMFKCFECKIVVHTECKDQFSVSCTLHSRNQNALNGGVSPIIVHCINEIEKRGLEIVGLYRISGSEKEIKLLKEKFNNSLPCLDSVDIHVLCSYLKEYIRTQNTHLISEAILVKFGEAVQNFHTISLSLNRIVFQLPSVNRITLAYLILHLQKVARSKSCNMDVNNLAIVFGPTIVGYSSSHLNDLYVKSKISAKVIKELIKLPSSFWLSIVNNDSISSDEAVHSTPSHNKLQTPSSSSRRFFPSGIKRRILESPKSAKQVKIGKSCSQDKV
ncbi:rac GTPase-activating protein 1-like isoform X2 [Daktulosphaira vitifoliae]|nr:rac GTPase-activating protein 1-like isoform X2 [Daktulosphaira vitifoliae]